jgi:hypothetical protein
MVSLTPVGSSDTASYAAYGHIAAQGGDPYTTNPQAWGDYAYWHVVGTMWSATRMLRLCSRWPPNRGR